ncbi:LPXTG cell wall anchor domain-containing protein, partial [Microbacterium sp. SCN 71-17]|uniref:LPXTG cell wall anchor domain-containing protein n=1 Tax=Microbacterium sp. SCN 71-17 TaxID=1660111 RepID=UPI000ADDB094
TPTPTPTPTPPPTPAPSNTPVPAPSSSAATGSPGALATTGTEVPWGLALGGAFFLVAGGLAFALRKRRTV